VNYNGGVTTRPLVNLAICWNTRVSGGTSSCHTRCLGFDMDSDNPTGADNQQETLQPGVQLEPAWIAGFVDGEGCFSVSVHSNAFMRRHGGWQIYPAFHVYQHSSYRHVLDALRSCFDCGYVRSKGPQSSVLTYSVSALRDLEDKIVPFFEVQRLLVKDRDFRSFAEIVRSMRRKEHLTKDGFERIVRLAYGMNANGKQRSRTIEEVLEGSSETVREARISR
jgi:hypothetical protein